MMRLQAAIVLESDRSVGVLPVPLPLRLSLSTAPTIALQALIGISHPMSSDIVPDEASDAASDVVSDVASDVAPDVISELQPCAFRVG